MYWLATPGDQTEESFIRRFSPRYWTINFPRPMMASTVTTGYDSLAIDLVFYRYEDLCGLIWDSVDSIDHPFHSYETSRDYSRTVLSFRWQSSNIMALDLLNSPTLTIEGRDQNGTARTWYVRLWNYATGLAEDAVITLDFDNLAGGFLHPSEADPVYPGDIDRMFISMVPSAFDGTTTGPLPAAVEGQVTVSDIKVTGPTSTLRVGDGYVQGHSLRLANGYDDVTSLAPERVIWNMLRLGYGEWINHYVGMSHYYNLSWDAGEGRYIIDPAKAKLNRAAASWHKNFLELADFFNFRVIFSLSYEILADNIPESWQQKAHDGMPARTGWLPPSGLIAPTNQAALDYLRDVFLAFGQIIDQVGADHHYQIGEPWWWIDQGGAGVPHFYDDVTTALYTTETTNAVPPPHLLATEVATSPQQDYLDWLGDKLGLSTLWLKDQVKIQHPTAEVGLLFYSPQVLLDNAPMAGVVNFPTAHWQTPAFDFLQVEDYDFVLNGEWGKRAMAIDRIDQNLSYPRARTHYFGGFNLLPETPENWKNIIRAVDLGFQDDYAEVFVWAYPQIVRDGVIYTNNQENIMTGFHETRLPEDISYGASGGPQFLTNVVEMASGHEQRNREWAEARNIYDIGLGLRSENDLGELLGFFRARAGRAYGFRYKDWLDYKSSAPQQNIAATDQILAMGDGATVGFQLVKTYDSGGLLHVRNIAKPATGTVTVALDGVIQATGWQVDVTDGVVTFDVAPANGVVITAGYEFDVPVRFLEDFLPITLESYQAGQVPSISLIEVRL
ncbi:Similar to phage capsid and scaffold / Gene Transfer Agent (GTA) ORFG12 [hydrothermal vent metagenome]|uniref:Similar to phage capsid and scaffold / Gene Transfer Agent (GTA) ORFG12 n=1 Tax=hydrothermal vent metagenome TaxID=652676 RepID=A0A3B0SRI7_9ZZZZ